MVKKISNSGITSKNSIYILKLQIKNVIIAACLKRIKGIKLGGYLHHSSAEGKLHDFGTVFVIYVYEMVKRDGTAVVTY